MVLPRYRSLQDSVRELDLPGGHGQEPRRRRREREKAERASDSEASDSESADAGDEHGLPLEEQTIPPETAPAGALDDLDALLLSED